MRDLVHELADLPCEYPVRVGGVPRRAGPPEPDFDEWIYLGDAPIKAVRVSVSR
jgi:hypothetical protein